MSGLGGPLGGVLGGDPDERFTCSRAGCTARADVALLWRNPKIHSPERRKTWLACADHRETLVAFLSARDFPLRVVPVDDLEDA
ncbi:hypothetical protein K8P10_001618 [Leucobacter sp. Psy1]|uniref:hypothetical protein n=1 Tax=Leucobacter sp. Psy1 TaxID=2875729 RepID=UPI001CD7022A|nr:hypothetical protein [Leucobacter sp. Psy1]UBH06107.1 hypothetical protein K8P10_001618 [Leucobacter sp. Psy1]